jgi:hypothetical protein
LGGLFSKICDCDKRLDPQLQSVAHVLIRAGDVATPESHRCRAPNELTANGRVYGLLDILGLSAGLCVLLLAQMISSHSSLPPCKNGLMRFTDCEALARMVPLTCKRPRIVTLTETVCDKLYAADTDAEKPSNNACGSSPKYLELSGRGAHVIDQCGLVLVTFNKHAN